MKKLTCLVLASVISVVSYAKTVTPKTTEVFEININYNIVNKVCQDLAAQDIVANIQHLQQEGITEDYVLTLMTVDTQNQIKMLNKNHRQQDDKPNQALAKAVLNELKTVIVSTVYTHSKRLNNDDLAVRAAHECRMILREKLSDEAFSQRLIELK